MPAAAAAAAATITIIQGARARKGGNECRRRGRKGKKGKKGERKWNQAKGKKPRPETRAKRPPGGVAVGLRYSMNGPNEPCVLLCLVCETGRGKMSGCGGSWTFMWAGLLGPGERTDAGGGCKSLFGPCVLYSVSLPVLVHETQCSQGRRCPKCGVKPAPSGEANEKGRWVDASSM